MEVLNKSRFSLQMRNCPIPVAEHSGHCLGHPISQLNTELMGSMSVSIIWGEVFQSCKGSLGCKKCQGFLTSDGLKEFLHVDACS